MLQKVVELIRVSTAGQAEDDRAGIPAQRAVIRRIAQAYGLEIAHKIEMADVSGTAVLRAPEMQHLLHLIQDPAIVGVVCREFSRLMRPERFEDFILLQAFADSNTKLYLPDGPIDLSTKVGSFMGGMRALIAGWERREILERMQTAKEEMRKAGRHAAGRYQLPFGVAYSKENGWSYTPEAEKIKRAFDLVLSTSKPYARIADELNLSRTSLRCILQNPIWIGLRVYTHKLDQSSAGYVPRADGRQGYRRKIPRAPDEVIRVRVMEQGLVTQDQFDAVQRILNDRAAREREVRTKNAPQFTFNGFLRCGMCESPMYPHKNNNANFGRDGRHYYCKRNGTRARRRDPNSACATRYVMAGKIEPKIETLLSERLQDEAFLQQIAEGYVAPKKPHVMPIDKQAIQAQIENLRQRRRRVLDAFLDGVVDRNERNERLRAIDADLRAYQSLRIPNAPEEAPVTVESLLDLFSVFLEFSFLDREDKRSLLQAVGAKIFVVGYKICSISMHRAPTPDCDTDSHLKTVAYRLRGPPCP